MLIGSSAEGEYVPFNHHYRMNIKLQVGGGLRSVESVRPFINANIARCVVGTKAAGRPRAAEDAGRKLFPVASMSASTRRDGKVVTKGWVNISETVATEFVKTLSDLPLGEIIYTDIERDGMMEGPNFAQLEGMLRVCPFPLIASGGVTTLDNVRRCKELGCRGAIIGKALYDGRMQLKDAMEAAGDTNEPTQRMRAADAQGRRVREEHARKIREALQVRISELSSLMRLPCSPSKPPASRSALRCRHR